MLSKYSEWAPGDQQGIKHYAMLESLKRAVSSAGLGVTTTDLTITRTAETADYIMHSTTHPRPLLAS